MRAARGWPFAVEVAVLAAVLAAVYAPLLVAPLQYDDAAFVLGDPRVAGPWPGWTAMLGPAPSGPDAYEPLSTLIHRGLHALAGQTPWPYRATSLLLHWGAAALLLSLLRRRLSSPGLAFWGALLFALYPAHAETLAVSTFKKHLLVALAALGSLELLDRDPRPGRRTAAACWALFAAALLVKESAFLVPLLSALALAARGERPLWTRARRTLAAGWAALAFSYLLLRASGLPPPLQPPASGSWPLHALASVLLLFWYIPRLLLPFGLCLEHSFPALLRSGPSIAAGAAASGAGLLALAWALKRLWRADRAAAFGAAWALAGLAPFLNLLPFVNYSLAADRYLYLACAGALLCAARGTDRAARRSARLRGLLLPALASAALALGLSASARARLFADPLELWTKTASCAPSNPRAHFSLGAALLDAGEARAAVGSLERALSLDPGYADAEGRLSLAYAELGRTDEALAAARRRVELWPDPRGWNNLGALLLAAGRPAEARPALERAAALAPSAAAQLSLAACARAEGRLAEARERFEKAAADPAFRARGLAGLAELEASSGRREEAARLYEASLASQPLQPEAAVALARLLSSLGREDRALEVLDRALAEVESSLAALRAAPPGRYRAQLRRLEADRRALLGD